MDKRNASRITSSRSIKSATFLLAGWRLLHPKELPGDLPVPLECHTLTMKTIMLQLSDAVADISMLQCSAQIRILIITAHFVADNSTHAFASSATAKPTFNVEEEVVVIHNGWTPKKRRRYMHMYVCTCLYMSICMYIYVHTYAHIYVYVYIYIYGYVLCIYVLCVNICMKAHMCICLHVFAFMCVYMCIQIC